MFTKFLIAVGLFWWPVYALADTINLDTQTNHAYFVAHSASDASFIDKFSFSVPNLYQGQAVALDLSYLNLLNITGLRVYQDVLSINTINYSLVSNFVIASGVEEPPAYLSTAFSAGKYIFDVTGVADGQPGGQYVANYSLTLSTLPIPTYITSVPAPVAVWLFGTGLMGLLYTGKRKQMQHLSSNSMPVEFQIKKVIF